MIERVYTHSDDYSTECAICLLNCQVWQVSPQAYPRIPGCTLHTAVSSTAPLPLTQQAGVMSIRPLRWCGQAIMKCCRDMLLTQRHMFLALLANSIVALGAAQGTGTLLAGQTLPQVSVHAALIQQTHQPC